MSDIPDPQAAPTEAGKLEPPTVELPAGPDALPSESAAGASNPLEKVRPFGDYELLDEIGRGGMGVVYRARDRHSGHFLALKMMLSERSEGSTDLKRFSLEARAAGELSHPGIVAIHAWGEHDGHPFYTMDFITGVPLNRIIEKGPLPNDQAVRYLVGIARAVAAAHALGIVHRDLKPSNVIIDANDQPRILDFGLAKRQRVRVGEPAAGESFAEALPANATMVAPSQSTAEGSPQISRATREGVILGTPTYMSPEQARGEHSKIGPAADVHALGILFYEMLLGRPPFQGGSVADTLKQVEERAPPPMWVEGRRVPASLEKVCRRCLRKDPQTRYADAGALADDLEKRWEWARQGPRYARLTLASGVAVALLICLRLLLFRWLPLGMMEFAGRLAPANSPSTAEAAGVLALLVDGVVFIGASLLALATSLIALVGWIWHSRDWWPDPPERGQGESSKVKSEPFLQRLFAAGGDRQGRKGGGGSTDMVGGLNDIELLKVLHRWPGGQLHRGRQKSLDRPILVWQETGPVAADAPRPGLLVRHPHVLGLHAVIVAPEGRFLVTEFAAALPLAELLQRNGLQPRGAVQLAARVARALQAFHDLGACHGRLSPEWILVHGYLEPLLCPCGVPNSTEEERSRDCVALGRLLEQWLPPRPSRWQRQPFAAVYQVCEAAGRGHYSRPVDFADDLDRAMQEAVIRRRERWATAGVALLAVFPLLFLSIEHVLVQEGARESIRGGVLAAHWLLALAPSLVLLGFFHGRILVHRYRLRLRTAVNCFRPGRGALRGMLQLVLLSVLPVLIVRLAVRAADPWLPAMVIFLGYWLVGMLLAGLVGIGEALHRSFQLRPMSESER